MLWRLYFFSNHEYTLYVNMFLHRVTLISSPIAVKNLLTLARKREVSTSLSTFFAMVSYSHFTMKSPRLRVIRKCMEWAGIVGAHKTPQGWICFPATAKLAVLSIICCLIESRSQGLKWCHSLQWVDFK